MTRKPLGQFLKEAREAKRMTLREVEAKTQISNAHLSQIESGKIAQPEMSLLYTVAMLYELDYERLLVRAGYGAAEKSPGRERQRMSMALRAMGELSAKEQNEVLGFMADLRRQRKDA